MEEDIKILEDYIELIKKGYCEDCNELCNIYGTPTYPAKKISEATEHLIKAYKELEEENRIFALEGSRVRLEMYIDKNYIPVSLVEEKIEELNKEEQELQNSISDEEKEEFINKRNCLLVQKYCYEEILKFVKGE